RKARAGEAGREAELSWSSGVGRQSIEAIHEIAGDCIRSDLRVVNAVAAANRQTRIAAGKPAETQAWSEIVLVVRQCLPVIAKSGVESQILVQVNSVLNEAGVEPLCQLVAADAEVDRLRVILNVGERELIEGRRRGVLERERAQDRGAGLAARAAGRVMDCARAEAEVVIAARPRKSVRQLCLMAEQVRGSRLSDRERNRS